MEERIAAIEYNLRRLMALQRVDWEEPPVPASLPQEALDHLARGDKLDAIKALADKLGIGIAAAKEMIERKR